MIEMSVPDMTCGHCVAAIREAVSGIDKAAACDVDLDTKRVRVASAMPPSDFVEALEAVGYSPVLVRAIG